MRRLGYAIWLVVSSAVLLELVLWIGYAINRARLGGEPITPAAGLPVVLCVGDSYTFGMGASAPETSYPSQLAAALSGDRAATVVNRGWPGQNSYDVASRLDEQLAESRPRRVCILVGANDRWRTPRRHSDGFEFRWRTGLLIDWLIRNPQRDAVEVGTSHDPAPEPPPDPSAPSAAPRAPELPAPTVPIGSPAPALPPDAVAADVSGRGERVEPGPLWALYDAQRFADAIGGARAALERRPANVEDFHCVIANSLAQLGRRDDARESIAVIEAVHVHRPTEWTAQCLLSALHENGAARRAHALARELAARHPTSAPIWYVLSKEAARANDVPTAIAATEHALALLGSANPGMQVGMMHSLARCLAPVDGSAAFGWLARALLVGVEVEKTVETMRTTRIDLQRDDAEAWLASATLADAARARVRAAIDEVFGVERGERLDILAENLRAMIAACRAAGAEPLILGYPMHLPAVESVQRAVAAETGAPFVDVCARFDAEPDRAALFVADGHCNDAGYAIVARAVADALASR